MVKAPKPAKRASKGGSAAPATSFEGELARLETLVGRLEEGELGLEESLEAFEEGIGLTRGLMKRLDEAEKRIEVLLEREGGEYETRVIDTGDLEEAAKRGTLQSGEKENEEDDG